MADKSGEMWLAELSQRMALNFRDGSFTPGTSLNTSRKKKSNSSGVGEKRREQRIPELVLETSRTPTAVNFVLAQYKRARISSLVMAECVQGNTVGIKPQRESNSCHGTRYQPNTPRLTYQFFA